jgi:hypothetical protein
MTCEADIRQAAKANATTSFQRLLMVVLLRSNGTPTDMSILTGTIEKGSKIPSQMSVQQSSEQGGY